MSSLLVFECNWWTSLFSLTPSLLSSDICFGFDDEDYRERRIFPGHKSHLIESLLLFTSSGLAAKGSNVMKCFFDSFMWWNHVKTWSKICISNTLGFQYFVRKISIHTPECFSLLFYITATNTNTFNLYFMCQTDTK